VENIDQCFIGLDLQPMKGSISEARRAVLIANVIAADFTLVGFNPTVNTKNKSKKLRLFKNWFVVRNSKKRSLRKRHKLFLFLGLIIFSGKVILTFLYLYLFLWCFVAIIRFIRDFLIFLSRIPDDGEVYF
jgi:hypothetical protein